MKKRIIKINESQLEELIKKISSEENKPSNKTIKTIKEGKNVLKQFHTKKKTLINEGISKTELNEQLSDFLGGSDSEKSIFGDIGLGSAKQWITSWILGQLGIQDPNFNKILSIALTEIEPKDYVKLFDPVDNCTFLSDVMFETFLKFGLQKLGQTLGGKVGSGTFGSAMSSDIMSIVFANSLNKLIDNVEFKRDLKKIFRRAVCQALGGESGEKELSSELETSEMPKTLVKTIQQEL